MRNVTLGAAIAALLIVQPLRAQSQTPMQPAAPGTAGAPVWQGAVRLADGRTFVTDGGLAVDAAFAKPATVPTREFASKILEDYMKAPHKNDYGFADLTPAGTGKSYMSPDGIAISSTYVDYLRRIAPRGSRFRTTERERPIVVVADGKPIAVLMPIKQ
jgi:hypothetical protein